MDPNAGRGRARGRTARGPPVAPAPAARPGPSSQVGSSASSSDAQATPIGRAHARQRQGNVSDVTQQTSRMGLASVLDTKRKLLSPSDKLHIIKMLNEGLTESQVAEKFAVPLNFVQYVKENEETIKREHQSGRGSSFKKFKSSSDEGSKNGNGDNGNGSGDSLPVGRGVVRSGRTIDIQALRTRPQSAQTSKKGASGTKVNLSSNHFMLKTDVKWCLYKHHVDFNPPEDRTGIRRALMRIHKDKFSGYLFDGSTLFTIRNACPQGPLELISEKNNGEKVSITVKFVGTCEPGDYQYLQVFNIILRECLSHLNLQLIRRNYFDPAAKGFGNKIALICEMGQKLKVQIPEFHLELWPGYQTAIGQYENNILLNAEITYKVLRRDTAYDLFKQCIDRGGDFKNTFDNAIIGCVVLTNYNNKTYRIDEVDYSSNPRSTFPKKKKGETTHISYIDYYQEHYSLRIRDINQPMLISKSKARDIRAGLPELIYLVPEYCVMTGLTDDMRSNHQLMRAVAQHTAVGPKQRVERLMNFSRRLNEISQVREKLNSWGMQLASKNVNIPGRILPPETIVVGDGRQYDSGQLADWTRNLRSNKMLLNVELKNWVIIYPQRSEREARNFCDTLNQVSRGMFFRVERPAPYAIQDDRAGSYVMALDRAINERNPQLVLCVVSNQKADRYSAIKKKCIVDKPTPSQVVLFKTITNKGLMSIATKIAIQLNCKIGGAPWSVPIPASGLMVVGFDVCHDPKDKRKSFSGMVATLDKSCARYFSCVTHHTAGEELSNNFALNMAKAIERYQRVNNGELPKVIVIYRDGVGDGNLRYTFEQEVENIKKYLNDIYKPKNIPLKLAFIVISKRINTRIFNGDQNPPPGTVVDDIITNPLRYDFFLVSQSVRQGTVAPTHYNVLADTTGWAPDQLQRLSYKFTHLYFNWSGTVRVPAPCQYAHKLAFLTAQYVGFSHTNLDQLLYFL